jgi:hypothetical protein
MAWNDKTISQKEAVKAFAIYNDGVLDLNASIEKFRNVALQTLVSQEAEDTLIVTCLNDLFDQYRGASLHLNFIQSQTVARMAKSNPSLAEHELFGKVSARIAEVMGALTDKPAAEAKGNKPAREAVTGRPFGVKRGPNGGHFRNSDQVPAK